MFTGDFDTRAFDRQLSQLARLDQFGAFGRALTRAQQSMRKASVEQARDVLNIKAGPVRDVVETRRVQRGDFNATVRIKSRPLEIIDLNRTRWLKKSGVSVQVFKAGPRKIIRGAFIATMRSGKHSAFQRRINAGTGRRVGRLPVDIIYTKRVRQALNDRRRQEVILRAGRDRFVTELRSQIAYRLSRAA